MSEHNMKESTKEKVKKKSPDATKNNKKGKKMEPTVHKEAEKPLFVLLGILLGALIVGITFFIASVNRSIKNEPVPVRIVPAEQAEYDTQAEQNAANGLDANGNPIDDSTGANADGSADGSQADGSGVNGAGSAGLDITSGVVTEIPDVEEKPVVGVIPSQRPGKWYLLNYNREKFSADKDEKLEIDNVCGKNRGVTTYCDNVNFSSSSAPTKGQEKCPACTVGQTCLLWDGDEDDDDGDLRVDTATYLCE